MTDLVEKLKERLDGNTILFVDDQTTTVGNYMVRLRDLDIKCELVDSLDKALERINQKERKLGFVILDLFMEPPNSKELKRYTNKLGLEGTAARNQGRALGQYLWDKRDELQLPYCYFTAYPGFYGSRTDEFNGDCTNFVLNKAAILPSQFAAELEKVFEHWDDIVQKAAA